MGFLNMGGVDASESDRVEAGIKEAIAKASVPPVDDSYVSRVKALTESWIASKKAGLSDEIVRRHLAILGTLGISPGRSKKDTWWFIVKAAILGGAIYGGYRLVSDFKEPPEHDYDESE